MSEILESISLTAAKNHQEMLESLDKLYQVAKPDAVFSEPMEVDDQVVFTASEINLGVGVGFGFGGGPRPGPQKREAVEGASSEDPGMGGGGGGGGGASGRPVAVISVSDQGVEVEPIIDFTKVILAFLTTIGSMLVMFSQIKKKA